MVITECPRDAMQGIKNFIPTEKKIEFINLLLKLSFDIIDIGSFVSPKAIPQMKDTAQVLKSLNIANSNSKLLVIVANKRGAEDACSFDEVQFLGYPFSVSETFQKRNTNTDIKGSLKRLEEIQNLCIKKNKDLLIYLSMAFGNPYGDKWNPEIVYYWAETIYKKYAVKFIALADTIGVSNEQTIKELFSYLINSLPDVKFSAHFHSKYEDAYNKIDAAYKSGCSRFDAAIKGFGGCPMAKDELIGNIPTEILIKYAEDNNINLSINKKLFKKAIKTATEIMTT